MHSADFINFWLSLGTIGLQIASVILLVALFSKNNFRLLIEKHSLLIGFLAVLASVSGSLIYSLAIGFTPCELCWYQRILLFPQVILLIMALWKKDIGIWIYLRVLSLIGAAIAAYHYYGQMFNSSSLPCPATGPSCAQVPFVEFGYITIPMMSLSVFIFLFILSFYATRRD
jgi:disulfide bond formation protein DsbB